MISLKENESFTADSLFKQSRFWFFSLLLTYSFFWIPAIHIFPSLSPGDMGRDLYQYQRTLEGELPFRDYWTQYGPLMFFYYAFWFLVGGVNLMSARIALGVIYLLTAVSAYLALRLFVSPAVAFLSSLAFLNLDMTWTFNHIGALPLMLLSIFCLWKFFLTQRSGWCYGGALALTGVALIKISAGLAAFLAFYLSVALYQGLRRNPPLKHLIFLPLLFAILTAAVYGLLFLGSSFDWIKHCLTFESKYRISYNSPWTNFKHLILRYTVWEPVRLLGVAAVFLSALLGYFGLKKGTDPRGQTRIFFFVLVSLVFFGAANSLDYFLMEGYIYRFDFWLFPITVLLLGLLGGWGSAFFQRPLRIFLGGLIFLALTAWPFQNLRQALAWKIPERYLDFPQGKVYLGGALSDVQVMKEGTRFLMEHTKPEEEILAIPYNPVYCFLSNRRHAAREFQFMRQNQVSLQAQEEIIQRLETRRVPFVLISNQYRSEEKGFGNFGETHCQRLAQYLWANYGEVQTFGSWDPASGDLHAIKLLRKKG